MTSKVEQLVILGTEIGVGGTAMTAIPEAEEATQIEITDMKIKIEGVVEVKVAESLMTTGVEVKKIFRREDAGHGKIMTQVTEIAITATGTTMATIMVIEVGDGTVTGDKRMVIETME